jgi:hypothetical protein
MPALRPRLSRARAAAAAAAVAVAASALVTVTASPAAAVVPKTPVALPVQVEPMPPYQPQRFCDPDIKPGTAALAHLLTTTYAGSSIVSLTRPCGGDTSEHYDGRAIDWGVDHRNDKTRAQGKAFLHWLFAANANGDDNEMVRRLGVMYVIWNKEIWGSWSQRWEPYSCSGATACHVDHMHISLDWSGAMRKTSFWTGKVSEPMDPPLYALRQIGVEESQTVDARDADPTPVFKVIGGGRYRLTVSGSYHYDDLRRHRADAECSTSDGSDWSPLAADDESGRSGQLDLWVNGRNRWRPVTPDGNGCDATHHYQRTVTFPDNAPLTVSLHLPPDRWTADGSVTLTVRRLS